MPNAKITAGHITVELSATEISIEALGKQALDLVRDTMSAMPPRNEVGFGGQHIERRGTWNADWHRPVPTINPDVNA